MNIDKNECALGTHNCDSNATCANTQGSFTCSCNSGYYGSGISCNGNNFFLSFFSFPLFSFVKSNLFQQMKSINS